MLEKLSQIDHKLSQVLAVCATAEKAPLLRFRQWMLALEWTAHEVVWFPTFITMIVLATPSNILEGEFKALLYSFLPMLLAIFVGLVVDICIVAALKIAFKRARPMVNTPDDMFTAMTSVDVYSFPSGDTSRMTMLSWVTCSIFSETFSTQPFSWPLYLCAAFIIALALSRIFLGRHFPSDIIAGLVIGVLVARLVLNYFAPLFEHHRQPISTVLYNLKNMVKEHRH